MVEISLSGSGEGPGGAIPWGYSTGRPPPQGRSATATDRSVRAKKDLSSAPIGRADHREEGVREGFVDARIAARACSEQRDAAAKCAEARGGHGAMELRRLRSAWRGLQPRSTPTTMISARGLSINSVRPPSPTRCESAPSTHTRQPAPAHRAGITISVGASPTAR